MYQSENNLGTNLERYQTYRRQWYQRLARPKWRNDRASGIGLEYVEGNFFNFSSNISRQSGVSANGVLLESQVSQFYLNKVCRSGSIGTSRSYQIQADRFPKSRMDWRLWICSFILKRMIMWINWRCRRLRKAQEKPVDKSCGNHYWAGKNLEHCYTYLLHSLKLSVQAE
jgi:hypothetical protein